MTVEQDVIQLRDRVHALETRLRALESAIVVHAGGMTIQAAGGLEIDAGGSLNIVAGGQLNLTAGNNMTLTTANNLTASAGRNAQFTVGSKYDLTAVTAALAFQSNYDLRAGGGVAITAGGSAVVTAGRTIELDAGTDVQIDAGRDLQTLAGRHGTQKFGKSATIQAADELQLQVGAAHVDMKKDGHFEIKGKDIHCLASGAMELKSSSNLTLKGQKILQN